MQVLGIVGMPGSGKSEAAAVAEELDIPVVTMGDVIRAECRDRDLEVTEENLGRVATALREEHGPGAIADRSRPLIDDRLENHGVVLVDGIRSDVEVDAFEDAYGEAFTLVSIEAPFETRLERIRERGRDETAEDRADLEARDEREIGYGMGRAMDAADVRIENTASLATFQDRIRELLEPAMAKDP